MTQVQTHYAEAFTPTQAGHYQLDLYHLAKLQLHEYAVTDIYGGEYCTYTDAERFYSHRRDSSTGRMASLIWLV